MADGRFARHALIAEESPVPIRSAAAGSPPLLSPAVKIGLDVHRHGPPPAGANNSVWPAPVELALGNPEHFVKSRRRAARC